MKKQPKSFNQPIDPNSIPDAPAKPQLVLTSKTERIPLVPVDSEPTKFQGTADQVRKEGC